MEPARGSFLSLRHPAPSIPALKGGVLGGGVNLEIYRKLRVKGATFVLFE